MKKHIIVSIALLSIFISGCARTPTLELATAASVQVPERHRELARQLVLITSKADGELRYGKGFQNDSEISPFLQRKFRRSYSQFTDSDLKFHIDDGHVIGLVCDKVEGYGIAEDLPCTPDADITYAGTDAECRFTLHSKDKCFSEQ
jgi:hypothetical protein